MLNLAELAVETLLDFSFLLVQFLLKLDGEEVSGILYLNPLSLSSN